MDPIVQIVLAVILLIVVGIALNTQGWRLSKFKRRKTYEPPRWDHFALIGNDSPGAIAARRWLRLTDRERRIAFLVLGGKSDAEVATEIDSTERMVEIHMAHILIKLELRSRAEWMREALYRQNLAPVTLLQDLD